MGLRNGIDRDDGVAGVEYDRTLNCEIRALSMWDTTINDNSR